MPGSALAPCLLPERRNLCGPVTARRIARLCFIYFVCLAVGLAIVQTAGDPRWQAFGLGLLFPGGGFLAHADLHGWHGAAHVGVAAAAFLLFVVALLLWFATGNAIAPPLAWLLAALAAAAMDHGGAEPRMVEAAAFAVGAAIVVLAILALARRWRGGVRRREANRYLAAAGTETAISFLDSLARTSSARTSSS
jgi:hypothetical protein